MLRRSISVRDSLTGRPQTTYACCHDYPGVNQARELWHLRCRSLERHPLRRVGKVDEVWLCGFRLNSHRAYDRSSSVEGVGMLEGGGEGGRILRKSDVQRQRGSEGKNRQR